MLCSPTKSHENLLIKNLYYSYTKKPPVSNVVSDINMTNRESLLKSTPYPNPDTHVLKPSPHVLIPTPFFKKKTLI